MAEKRAEQHSMEAVVIYGRRKRRSLSDGAEEEEEEVQHRLSPSLRSLSSPSKQKYKQSFLDFGQQDFSYSTCKICGLLYARGHSDDEKLHALFHKRYIRGVLFKGWQKERVVVKHEKADERIILVLHSDPPQHQLKVKELLKIMEKDLGAEPGWLLHDGCKVFLYISLKKVIGCAMAEPISQAYPVICKKEPTAMQSSDSQSRNDGPAMEPGCAMNGSLSDRDGCCQGDTPELLISYGRSSAGKASEEPQQQDEVGRVRKHSAKTMVFGGIKFQRERVRRCNNAHNPVATSEVPAVCTGLPVAAVCGIRGLWVSKAERRRGIATRLMDAVRTSFVYGMILDASQCAFSQPTPDGKAFVAKYTRTENYLVYS